MAKGLGALRTTRGWTQDELAKKLSISPATLNAIETGKYDPSRALAYRTAQAFGLPLPSVEEVDLAREVQEQLLRHRAPVLETITYSGRCIPARSVGGDYYDFLELGPARLGLVLGDVCGKGLSAALMMASLQACLRSYCDVIADDLARVLSSVNRQLCECTAANHYATLFLGDYDDRSKRLRYVNCGHNPPLLVHADLSVERLAATATVVGLLEGWDCTIAELTLGPGDTLLLFSDGVTEARNSQDEEFGEARLLETLRATRDQPPSLLVGHVAEAVRKFSVSEPADDVTVVAARVR